MSYWCAHMPFVRLMKHSKSSTMVNLGRLKKTCLPWAMILAISIAWSGRYYDETPYHLEQKLAENIWWLLSLAKRLDIDVQKEMETFLSDKEKQLGIGEVGDERL